MVEIAPRIVIDPAARFGKPVMRGTRAPVAAILAKLAEGMSTEELMQAYDRLQVDILAPFDKPKLENKTQKLHHA